jgi:hypothetical protein
MTEWQQITWVFFHTIALNYNNDHRDEYINFFDSLKTIIPCKICRNHYIQNVNNENMNINNNINSDKIFNWTIDLHNIVNKMHNKKIWSHEEARKYYNKHGFNNQIMKIFIFEYIKTNFKKNPEKTTQLIKMINTLPYMHPNPDKRNKLIDFKEKFVLNRQNMKKWLYAFLLILKA